MRILLLLKWKHYYCLLGDNHPSFQLSFSLLCFKTTKLIYAHYERFRQKQKNRKGEVKRPTHRSTPLASGAVILKRQPTYQRPNKAEPIFVNQRLCPCSIWSLILFTLNCPVKYIWLEPLFKGPPVPSSWQVAGQWNTHTSPPWPCPQQTNTVRKVKHGKKLDLSNYKARNKVLTQG